MVDYGGNSAERQEETEKELFWSRSDMKLSGSVFNIRAYAQTHNSSVEC